MSTTSMSTSSTRWLSATVRTGFRRSSVQHRSLPSHDDRVPLPRRRVLGREQQALRLFRGPPPMSGLTGRKTFPRRLTRTLWPAGAARSSTRPISPSGAARSRRPGNPCGLPGPRLVQDAKFGIFIHWGSIRCPHSATSGIRATCTKKGTPEFAHHVATFGPQSTFGYRTSSRIHGPNFDPAEWAALFQEAGPAMWCRSPNTTTASPCTDMLDLHRLERRPRWGPSAMSSASWPKPAPRRGHCLRRCPVTPRGALVVLRQRHSVRFRRARSAIRRRSTGRR